MMPGFLVRTAIPAAIALFSLATLLSSSARAQSAEAHPGAAEPAPAVEAGDFTRASSSVAARTILVRIVDAHGAPLQGQRVRLGIRSQTLGEADSRKEEFRETDGTGSARFEGLASESQTSYRVTLASQGAEYASAPFRLEADRGHEVLLHVYPVTSDLDQAEVGMTGVLYLAPRGKEFRGEVYLRVYNVGKVTWVPDSVVLQLPPGFRSFEAPQAMTDATFEEIQGRGARLRGTFPPGQHQMTFAFRLPHDGSERRTFEFIMPPRVAELTVVAARTPGMTLDVPGFDRAQAGVQNQERILVSRKQFSHQNPPISKVSVTLAGLPGPNTGRIWVTGFAVVLAGGGFFMGLRRPSGDHSSGRSPDRADPSRARELLLDELVLLEKARAAETIGPRTYQRARATLIGALVRLHGPPQQADAPHVLLSSETGSTG